MTDSLERRSDLDIARAFAAYSVVLIHIAQYYVRYGLEHFSQTLSAGISEVFHIVSLPTFFVISGIVYTMSAGQRTSSLRTWYPEYIFRKGLRLIVPFVAVSLMTLCMKFVAPGQSIPDVPEILTNMVVLPRQAPAPHLWFLYCLMSIFLIWPCVTAFLPKKLAPVLMLALFGLALVRIPLPANTENIMLFGLADLIWYVPYFAMGCCWSTAGGRARAVNISLTLAAGVGFAIAIAAYLFLDWSQFQAGVIFERFAKLAASVCIPFVLLGVGGVIARSKSVANPLLVKAGLRSYDIYLLHVAFVAHPLMFALGRLAPGAVVTYALFVPVSVLTVAVVMLLGWLVRKLPIAAFFVLGVPPVES